MNSFLLQSVIEATREAESAGASPLDRFLAAEELADLLRAWNELQPANGVGDRVTLIRRLGLEIALLDELLSKQVDAILHHPSFQALEARWRGLWYLVERAPRVDWEAVARNPARQPPGSENIMVRVLDLSWQEAAKDQARAVEFDQSQLFQKVYSQEFGMPGGRPFGVLLGDYEISYRPEAGSRAHPIDTIQSISQVAAAAFAPFIAAADPRLFGLDHFGELSSRIDLQRVFASPEYVEWNSLRDSEDVRFVGLALPRVLMRRPHGDSPWRIDGFRYEENVSAPDGSCYLWGSAVYAFGSVLMRSFSESGWLASIRGVEQDRETGGIVSDLVTDEFGMDAPGTAAKCPTEVVVTGELESELSKLGFIPLCHCFGTPFAAFYGNQSIQRPKEYDEAEANVNAKLSAMLQYILCVSRFAHYVKYLARNRIGSFSTSEELERFINDWLHRYTMQSDDADTALQARYPLREARVTIRELPGRPGVYNARIHLRPHFQLDYLTATLGFQTELLTKGDI